DFRSEDPRLSAFGANSFSQEFIRYHASFRTERSGESVEFLKQLVENKKAELDAKLEAQKSFASANQMYDPNESGIRMSQIASLEMERDIIRSRLYRLRLSI